MGMYQKIPGLRKKKAIYRSHPAKDMATFLNSPHTQLPFGGKMNTGGRSRKRKIRNSLIQLLLHELLLIQD